MFTARLACTCHLQGGLESHSWQGNLEDFASGLDRAVGLPNPKLSDTMEREHCNMHDSDTDFTTSNYTIRTASRIEWWFVVDPRQGKLELPNHPSASLMVKNPLAISDGFPQDELLYPEESSAKISARLRASITAGPKEPLSQPRLAMKAWKC